MRKPLLNVVVLHPSREGDIRHDCGDGRLLVTGMTTDVSLTWRGDDAWLSTERMVAGKGVGVDETAEEN